MRLSLIIPTLNEAENLAVLLPYLRQKADRRLLEIIVVDAGSSDDTLTVATDHGADVAFKAKHPGRGPQMNEAAQRASGNTLYFVHADSRPPVDFLDDIEHALEKGYQVGGYRFRFDSDKVLLKINAWFTRFPALACRGGDQTLWVTKELFDHLGGYRQDYRIMEDYDFIERARRQHDFYIVPKEVTVSARKYEHNNYFRVNLANLVVFTMYRMGYSQTKMIRMYQRLLDYRPVTVEQ